MADKYFEIGMLVKCITLHDETIQGEVIAFDIDSKSLVLKSPALNGKSENSDVKFVNLNYVGSLERIREAPSASSATQVSNLPTLNYSKLSARVKANVEEKMKKISYIGTGVSSTAQKLFDTILKTIPEVEWQGDKILVMKSVTIEPPYQAENCHCTNSQIFQNGQSLSHVRKIVTKFHDDHKETISTSSSSSTSPPAVA